MKRIVLGTLAVLLFVPIVTAQTRDEMATAIWKPVERSEPPAGIEAFAEAVINRFEGRRALSADPPATYREFELDEKRLDNLLAPEGALHGRGAAPRGASTTESPAAEIPIPLVDGGFVFVTPEPTYVLAPELAQQFPEVHTYRGVVAGTAGTARFERTPTGFFAAVKTDEDVTIVRPLERRGRYAVLRKVDAAVDTFECGTQGALTESARRPAPVAPLSSGQHLRTYRLAIATTAAYTAAVGGTVASAIESIARTVNRVNAIYESELAIRMQVVAGNEKLIHIDPARDTFNNSKASVLIDQSQEEIDRVIGDASYDIGHTFSTGAGGLAACGVGMAGRKALGVTGSRKPIGDAYDVDYVAHEMGHQFCANHTFNGDTGQCRGGTWNEATAYEPGSGTTILAYAGICGADNLEAHSFPYFHAASLREILEHVNAVGEARSRVATGNGIPTVTAGADGTIPTGTAFELTATGRDPDGDPLLYCWEQLDLGAHVALSAPDDGEIPLFASFPPAASPSRSFPKIGRDGLVSSSRERLPARQRKMQMNVTVRDAHADGGAIASDGLLLTVVDTAGPFRVRSVTQPAAGKIHVVWDVAQTDRPPITATNVQIQASSDGGRTFPFTLTSSTANDGAAHVSVPPGLHGPALLKVRAVDGYFFALSERVEIH